MIPIAKRWKSLDVKLPLLASALVVGTAAVLATAAYSRLESALIDSTGRRLSATAQALARLFTRPGANLPDTAGMGSRRVVVDFLNGKATESQLRTAIQSVARLPIGDTANSRFAVADTSGNELFAYRTGGARASRWAQRMIREGRAGDTLLLGPIETSGPRGAFTLLRPLRDSSSAPVLGYLIETRGASSSRSGREIRHVMDETTVLVGQPDAGVWTNLEHIAAAPPVRVHGDTIIEFAEGVGAAARIPNLPWVVWLSVPRERVMAPARVVLWSTLPIALAIGLIGAAITWRVTSRFVRPIVELTEAAENIAKDSGAPRMAPTILMPIDADEVARLRYAFERMALRVAERQTLELQLRHAQKMEAVGRLAGGVAHDFNNLLTAIRSYSDLLLDEMPEWDPKRNDALEIRAAAERAAALTAQLLAFSRKQMLQPRVLDTGAVLREMNSMLRRLMEVDIELRVDAAADIWAVKVDRGQLEQVIVNLAVNARDAMPHGGALTITGRNATLDEPLETRHAVVPAGDYVVITVTDSGVGMDLSTQARAFEPFFTTKPIGHGTGLGLATVHGIVAQSGGYITVHSAPQKGATFCVYFPRVDEKPDAVPAKPHRKSIKGARKETILIVEDEDAVRTLAKRVLSRAGYNVFAASSPAEALRLAEEHGTAIQLVLSDVVMPEMNGPALVEKLQKFCPQTHILFISGYTDDDIIARGLASPGLMLLQKPFSAQELVERVRQAIERKRDKLAVD